MYGFIGIDGLRAKLYFRVSELGVWVGSGFKGLRFRCLDCRVGGVRFQGARIANRR